MKPAGFPDADVNANVMLSLTASTPREKVAFIWELVATPEKAYPKVVRVEAKVRRRLIRTT